MGTDQTPPERQPEEIARIRYDLFLAALILIILIIFWSLDAYSRHSTDVKNDAKSESVHDYMKRIDSTKPSAAEENEGEDSTQAQSRLPVGYVGRAGMEDVPHMIVCCTKEAHEELCKYMAAHDTDGMRLLLLDGRAFTIDSGTKVKVLCHDWFKGITEVRVMGGDHSAESGWVFSATIH